MTPYKKYNLVGYGIIYPNREFKIKRIPETQKIIIKIPRWILDIIDTQF